jgi:uncharacterized protein (TIGR00266 family)
MKSDEIAFTILGDDIQLVEIELDPGETAIAEAGAMVYMEEEIRFDTRLGDGSRPGQGIMSRLVSAGSRVLTGESVFITHFSNEGRAPQKVAFAAPYPGTIIPINLSEHQHSVIVQKDGFLCAAYGTRLSLFFNRRIGSGLVGGEGFILQQLDGDGLAFVHAGGTVIEKELKNESLRIDTGCVVAFETSISFDVEKAGSLKSMIFGGEGLFVATLKGTGKVWLQSMPLRKLIQAISPYGKNTTKGSSSLLDGFLER